MGEIIQIKVEKGGVGKTFIASNLAHLLALLDYKVIICLLYTSPSPRD